MRYTNGNILGNQSRFSMPESRASVGYKKKFKSCGEYGIKILLNSISIHCTRRSLWRFCAKISRTSPEVHKKASGFKWFLAPFSSSSPSNVDIFGHV